MLWCFQREAILKRFHISWNDADIVDIFFDILSMMKIWSFLNLDNFSQSIVKNISLEIVHFLLYKGLNRIWESIGTGFQKLGWSFFQLMTQILQSYEISLFFLFQGVLVTMKIILLIVQFVFVTFFVVIIWLFSKWFFIYLFIS